MPVNADFNTAWRDYKASTDLISALTDMRAANAYIMVRSPETEPALRELFRELREQLATFLAHRDPGLRSCMLYLFISSPGCVTPFHVDRYITFLCQITGTKRVDIWDRDDRDVISETALETLFAAHHERGPLLRDEHRARSSAFELGTGQGVHIPFTSPHCVRNGDQVSVSIAFIYQTLATSRRESAHRFNHLLRKRFRLAPTPVGTQPWLDWIKFIGFRGTEKLLRRN
jgi:hypothetical protein